MNEKPLNRQDAIAISKAIWRYLNRYHSGSYPNYGWDWPTLRVLFPQIARTLKLCYRTIHATGVTQ